MVLRLRQILDNDFLPCNRGIDEDSAEYSHINKKADHGPTLGPRGCQVRVARRKSDGKADHATPEHPNIWGKQWKVGHSPASSSTSKACGVKYCELASRVDVGWDVASHCLFSSLGPCILGYVLALGLTFGPAILLFVSLLGLLSCFGPRILVCFLASGLAKLPPFLSCALL